MSHQVESATIEAKQKRLDNKINLANAGIVTIIQKLAQYSSNCPETNKAVAELVSSISPTSDSPNNHVQQEVECNLSSEDIKLICNQLTELFGWHSTRYVVHLGTFNSVRCRISAQRN